MSTQLRGRLYLLSYAVGFLLMLLITIARHKTYRTSILRAAVYCVVTFLSGLCGAVVICQLYDLFALMKGVIATAFLDVVGAVILAAVLLPGAVHTEKAFLRKKMKKALNTATVGKQPKQPRQLRSVSVRDTMDLVIPGAFTLFTCIKLGCTIRGCCFGMECSWGVVSDYYYNKTVFPVQAFESASIFIIVIASVLIQKAPFYRRGMSAPFAAFLYGAIRFFWEFFRYNPPELKNYFLGLTLWQLFCVLILIVTCAWFVVLIRTQPREPRTKRRVKAKKSGNNAHRKKRKKK